jgi:RNA polymerase sigma factor (sigma-70 family)
MPPSEQTRWFSEEVQPHEPALRAYLLARFPSLSDHDDLIQETYTRLLRAKESGTLRYARAFLFTAARNAALDVFRRRQVVSLEPVTDFKELSVLAERPGVAELVGQQQELEILAEAVRALPDRCRQVLMLRYLDGLSYKEIAAQLNISAETVKVHMAKGMRRCADYFAARGLLKTDSREPEEASA